MKISNFKKIGESGCLYFPITFAEVDVTTGALWWKKTERRKVFRRHGFWAWVDSGDFTPDFAVERLERAAEAQSAFKKYGLTIEANK